MRRWTRHLWPSLRCYLHKIYLQRRRREGLARFEIRLLPMSRLPDIVSPDLQRSVLRIYIRLIGGVSDGRGRSKASNLVVAHIKNTGMLSPFLETF